MIVGVDDDGFRGTGARADLDDTEVIVSLGTAEGIGNVVAARRDNGFVGKLNRLVPISIVGKTAILSGFEIVEGEIAGFPMAVGEERALRRRPAVEVGLGLIPNLAYDDAGPFLGECFLGTESRAVADRDE